MVEVTEGQAVSVCAVVSGATLEREVRVQLATVNLNDEKAACEMTSAAALKQLYNFLYSI